MDLSAPHPALGAGSGRSPGRPKTVLVTVAAAASLLATTATLAAQLAPASAATRAVGAAHQRHAVNKSRHKVNLEVPPKAAVNISETGSTLLYPLFQTWASAYHAAYKNISVTPQGTGSGTGISQAEAGAVDIGASDAYLSSSVKQSYPGLMNIALAISAQQVNYNIPGLSPDVHLKLTGPVISKIYQGIIKNWDDPEITALNPGVKIPPTPIVALHRSDGSGDTFLFTQYLTFSDPANWGKIVNYGTTVAWPAIASSLGENGNGGMVTGCASTPGCIAYIGISYLSQTTADHLGQAALQNRAGHFELPTQASIAAEAAAVTKLTPPTENLSLIYDPAPSGYPIINYEYAIVQQKQPNATVAAAVRAFLYWAVDPKGGSAPSFLSKVNFQPLPTGIAGLSKTQISKITG